MPKKYLRKRWKEYGEDDLESALAATEYGIYSLRDSSIKFGVPYTTLNRYFNNDMIYKKVGRPPKFNEEEEICLEQAAICLQVGYSFHLSLLLLLFFCEGMGYAIIN
jgi:hypothetical protein